MNYLTILAKVLADEASKLNGLISDEPMDGDQVEDLANKFIKELNKLQGNI